MQLELVPVPIEEREILANLLEKYDYEFSQYDNQEINKLGLYGYRYLDCYWIEDNRWAYFIKADGKLAGFVMVNDIPAAPDRPTDYCIAEFFVLYNHRRSGVGRFAAIEAFRRHPGRWQLMFHSGNIGSARFWNRVIGEFTQGSFELVNSCPGADYPDGTLGNVFFFTSPSSESPAKPQA